jgi:hypothetical protein
MSLDQYILEEARNNVLANQPANHVLYRSAILRKLKDNVYVWQLITILATFAVMFTLIYLSCILPATHTLSLHLVR